MLPGRRSHQFCRATRKRKGPRGLYRSRPRLLRNSARSLMENGAEMIRRLALVIREKLPDASSALRELAGGPLMNIIRELLTGGCVKCTTRVPPPTSGENRQGQAELVLKIPETLHKSQRRRFTVGRHLGLSAPQSDRPGYSDLGPPPSRGPIARAAFPLSFLQSPPTTSLPAEPRAHHVRR